MAKRGGGQYRIFFSHAHKDRWIALQCAPLIEERGKGRVRVFLDEKDIEAGQHIGDSIRNSIKECDEFVVLLSRYSKDRPWVLLEIGAAWGLEKLIVGTTNNIEPREMPDIMYPYKAVDLNDFDQYSAQLLKRAAVRR